MIFLCFSGHDRMTIVRAILYHLERFGLNVWYDNHEYVLGDNKGEKYALAIRRSRYAIVVFSKMFPFSPGAIEELEIIKEQYDSGLIHIFPIFYEISPNDIPPKYKWLSNMIYNELDESTGALLTCNQIAYKYYLDLLEQCKFKSLEDLLVHRTSFPPFISKIVENYYEIIPANINSRLTVLYCIFLFFETKIDLPKYLVQTAHNLFQNTKLALEYDFKEIMLMEHVVCLAATHYTMSSQE